VARLIAEVRQATRPKTQSVVLALRPEKQAGSRRQVHFPPQTEPGVRDPARPVASCGFGVGIAIAPPGFRSDPGGRTQRSLCCTVEGSYCAHAPVQGILKGASMDVEACDIVVVTRASSPRVCQPAGGFGPSPSSLKPTSFASPSVPSSGPLIVTRWR
jgi:hypothetical protein